ncbi:hypothetical protein [Treponema sp.]|uniref:hypothetical protein n=1 Tax=Treponema sp. TaxID=166 RepID=UPI00298E6DFC|nr:hypothetical protein [Treponema sp.]MCQ2242322.1 hypothetical protein [Treponema sp.]
MSRKTENIYKSIEALNGLEQKLAQYNQTAGDRDLDDIDFEMRQQLKNLKFWIDSLYSFNGKSTSRAKKIASRENGKKGGRPPKAVTLMKRRRIELEEQLIPELQRQKTLAETMEEEKKICQTLSDYEKELADINSKLPG